MQIRDRLEEDTKWRKEKCAQTNDTEKKANSKDRLWSISPEEIMTNPEGDDSQRIIDY